MATARLALLAKDVGPWTPGVDARRADKPSIVQGSNFRDTIDGPISSFATVLNDYNFFDPVTSGRPVSLRMDTDILYGTATGLFRLQQPSLEADVLLSITTTRPFWPWTMARVGGVYYLAQFEIGLWRYDPANGTLDKVTTPAGDTARYVVESYGRLIILCANLVMISALDDGTDLTPDLATAAGVQSTNLIGGEPLALSIVPDGFLVYGTGGIMKGTYTTAAYVFQFSKLTEAVRIFSPNSVVYIPGLGSLAIDAQGMWLTTQFTWTVANAGVPSFWEPIMTRYFQQNFLAQMNKQKIGCIQVVYVEETQLLFVLFGPSTQEGRLTSGFVWDRVAQRWGSFDHPTAGIVETYDAQNINYGSGYVGTAGYIRRFTDNTYSELLPVLPSEISDYVFRIGLTDPVWLTQNSVERGRTIISGADFNPSFYRWYTIQNLFSLNDEAIMSDTPAFSPDDMPISIDPISGVETGFSYCTFITSGGVELRAIPFVLPQQGLDASLSIGPFRANDQQNADETSCITTTQLGILATGNSVGEDWNVLSGSADWNEFDGTADWGRSIALDNTFDLSLLSSTDIFTAPLQGTEALPEFQRDGSTIIYKPLGWVGQQHMLTLNASEPGESFTVKTFDLALELTGSQANR